MTNSVQLCTALSSGSCTRIWAKFSPTGVDPRATIENVSKMENRDVELPDLSWEYDLGSVAVVQWVGARRHHPLRLEVGRQPLWESIIGEDLASLQSFWVECCCGAGRKWIPPLAIELLIANEVVFALGELAKQASSANEDVPTLPHIGALRELHETDPSKKLKNFTHVEWDRRSIISRELRVDSFIETTNRPVHLGSHVGLKAQRTLVKIKFRKTRACREMDLQKTKFDSQLQLLNFPARVYDGLPLQVQPKPKTCRQTASPKKPTNDGLPETSQPPFYSLANPHPKLPQLGLTQSDLNPSHENPSESEACRPRCMSFSSL